jgi:hypothetical protein
LFVLKIHKLFPVRFQVTSCLFSACFHFDRMRTRLFTIIYYKVQKFILNIKRVTKTC